jgi:hypothetical protein
MMQWKFEYFLQNSSKWMKILRNQNLNMWSLNIEMAQIIH